VGGRASERAGGWASERVGEWASATLRMQLQPSAVAAQPPSCPHTNTTALLVGCRNMILTMVGEPLVIAIKLADRLHNMRTV
jgi:hypothetical protein